MTKADKIKIDEAEKAVLEYLTDPTIPAIAKNMNCHATFEYKFKTKDK